MTLGAEVNVKSIVAILIYKQRLKSLAKVSLNYKTKEHSQLCQPTH